MNTTRHAYSIHECSATEALFDQIEKELLVLTTASLDGQAETLQCVDEFDDDFFNRWSRPPAMPPDVATERPWLAG